MRDRQKRVENLERYALLHKIVPPPVWLGKVEGSRSTFPWDPKRLRQTSLLCLWRSIWRDFSTTLLLYLWDPSVILKPSHWMAETSKTSPLAWHLTTDYLLTNHLCPERSFFSQKSIENGRWVDLPSQDVEAQQSFHAAWVTLKILWNKLIPPWRCWYRWKPPFLEQSFHFLDDYSMGADRREFKAVIMA